MISPGELIAQARALKGVRWCHQGRGRGGVDCIGLVVVAMRNAGVDLPKLIGVRDGRYSRRGGPEMLELVRAHLQPIEQPIPGALAFFKFYGEKYPRHFGIITENGGVIHANAKHSAVMEHGLRAHWANWLHSVWLLPGVDYGA